jgi:hypothetical protein
VVKTYFHETWRGDIINYGTFDSVRTKPSKMETRNAPPVGEHGVMYSPMSSIQSTSSEQQTNWGWNHWNRWNKWNLMAILDKSNRHISKERYVLTIAVVASLAGLIHGYLATFLGLINLADFEVTTDDGQQQDTTSSSSASETSSMITNSITSIIVSAATVFTGDGLGVSSSSTSLLFSYYVGIVLGSLLSFPASDIFGRKVIVVNSSMSCIFFVIWATFALSSGDLCSAVLFIGWMVGTLLAIVPCYVSEVKI